MRPRRDKNESRARAPRLSRVTAISALLVAALTLALAGCGYDSEVKDGGPVTTETGSSSTTQPPSTTDTTAPDETTTTTVAEETTDVLVYFLRDQYVAPVRRSVPATKAVATAAMEQLVAGPTAQEEAAGFATAIPEKSLFLGVSIQGSQAIVDLSKEYESGGGSTSMFARLAQVVYTLTQFPTVESVSFKLDGKPIDVFSGEGFVLDHPITREEQEYMTAPIHVDSPVWNDTVTSPLRVYGTSNVFEATSQIQILDDSGKVLKESVVTATSGTGTRGTYDVTISFDAEPGSDIVLRSFEYSAKDGSMINVVDIPLHMAE
jgi:germination protein M